MTAAEIRRVTIEECVAVIESMLRGEPPEPADEYHHGWILAVSRCAQKCRALIAEQSPAPLTADAGRLESQLAAADALAKSIDDARRDGGWAAVAIATDAYKTLRGAKWAPKTRRETMTTTKIRLAQIAECARAVWSLLREERAEWKRLSEAATPGPWDYRGPMEEGNEYWIGSKKQRRDVPRNEESKGYCTRCGRQVAEEVPVREPEGTTDKIYVVSPAGSCTLTFRQWLKEMDATYLGTGIVLDPYADER